MQSNNYIKNNYFFKLSKEDYEKKLIDNKEAYDITKKLINENKQKEIEDVYKLKNNK